MPYKIFRKEGSAVLRLEDGLEKISGIGPKKKEQLASIGLFTVRDALFHAPIRYEDRRARKEIAALSDGERTACHVVARGRAALRREGGKTLYFQTFCDGTGEITAVWQNSPHILRTFCHGESYVLYGRAFVRGRAKRMFSPLFAKSEEAEKKIGGIVPIYPTGADVSQTLLRTVIGASLSAADALPDILPSAVLRKARVLPLSEAIRKLHAPFTMAEAEEARTRLKFEELFLLFTGMHRERENLSKREGRKLSADLAPFFAALPFTLTLGQQNAIEDIRRDMASGRVMNRLIEGDVGSGKTAVAAAALYIAFKEGGQGILMAPTEILARQHAASLRTLLPDVPVVLLTGRLTAKEKRAALSTIESGKACAIVATQAVLNPDLALANISLVIVDEQHRFGVRQRGFLSNLASSPHVLVMSATPIPRTLSLTFYGDLDISILPARPEGREKVDTFVVPPSYRERLYAFIKKELVKGNRAYIICPRAEEGDGEISDAESYAASLSPYFEKDEVLCLHGKMKNKDEIMEKFAAGPPSVLVATTVVEVGVDVGTATVIVIENAERFGLSQLHELRGSVGRGTEKSYCVLVSEAENEVSRQRLAIMKNENDGFRIAEEDLRLRGAGEFFGTRQHGNLQLLYADLWEDSRLFPVASAAAAALLKEDGNLSKHPEIQKAVEALYQRFAMN